MEDVDFTQFPEGSVCRKMVVDIFVNAESGDVTILHDRAFDMPPSKLLFDEATNELTFYFETGGSMPFGVPLKDDVSEVLSGAKDVALFQVDRETSQIKNGVVIALKHKNT